MPEWITSREAAEILGVHMSAVPKMVRRGDLTPRRNRPRMNLAEVIALRDRRAIPKETRRARAPEPPDRTHDWLLRREAAELMGISEVAIGARARRERVPSELYEGRRWFRRDLLEMVRRAEIAKRRNQYEA